MTEREPDATSEPYTVPTAPFRPGDQPEFDSWPWTPADLERPDPATCESEDTREHAHGLVRVLGEDDLASGAWDPSLDADTLRRGLELMVLLRIFDDRMMKMQRTGKLSFYMCSLGEEAVAIAQVMALQEQDWIFPTYRQPGAQFVRGRDLVSMINHCIGNIEDNIKGRQMPVHYSYRDGRYISVSSPVGTQFPQAVGVAMASAYRGLDEVTITWIGDGASAEGDYHYALTFASVYKPPVILNVVNNQWAISTFQGIARGGSGTLAARGHGFGIPSLRVDGNDFIAVHAVAKWAVERARRNLGPTLVEYVTYRAGGHSTSDDPSAYRPREESAAWPLGDPVLRLKAHLIAKGVWSEERHVQAEAEVLDAVIAAQKESEAIGTLQSGRLPSQRDLFEDVFETMPPHLLRQRHQSGY